VRAQGIPRNLEGPPRRAVFFMVASWIARVYAGKGWNGALERLCQGSSLRKNARVCP
jgi:hypothetical protein